MKIAILGPAYPFRGGISQHTGLLCKNLRSANHEISLISFRKQFPGFLFPGKTQFEESSQNIIPESERIFIPWNPLSWFKTANKIIGAKADVVICIYWTPFIAAGYAFICKALKKKTKVPVLFILHNVIPHEGMPAKEFLTRRAFKYADGFISQSKKVEDELLSFYPAAGQRWRKIVPHPVYNFQEFSCPGKAEARNELHIAEGKVLLFFGLVRAYKGLKTLLSSFPEVLKYFDGDIRLIIAGEFYDPPGEYIEMIKRLGIEDKIEIHNRFIPNEEVGTYFSAADVLVLPYESASQSGVVQAAFGFGIPVISTEVGGLPEVIRHGVTGMLCPPSDPQALSATIIEFYKLAESVDFGKNIKDEVSAFSWDNFTNAIDEFTVEAGK